MKRVYGYDETSGSTVITAPRSAYAWAPDSTAPDDGAEAISLTGVTMGRYLLLPPVRTREHRRIARKSLVRLAGAVQLERLHDGLENGTLIQYYRVRGVRIPRSLR